MKPHSDTSFATSDARSECLRRAEGVGVAGEQAHIPALLAWQVDEFEVAWMKSDEADVTCHPTFLDGSD